MIFMMYFTLSSSIQSFSDVYFVDGTSAETTTSDLRNLALSKEIGDTAEDALLWLSKKNDEWLLVIDNADDPTYNLLDYFPDGSCGNIIVTSRNGETRIHAPDPQSSSKVPCLTPDDAIELLVRVSGAMREKNSETMALARKIVEVCCSTFPILLI
jgi:hypothetical protein